jgi:hypothetical protein
LLVLLWPLGTIAAFLAVPRLRKYWRSRATERTPLWWSWSVSGVYAIMVFWSAITFFRVSGPGWPNIAQADQDSPFHLALIGEAKHHMPMTTPWVPTEPVLYHWFVYAEMAATSWVTGIEPQVLLVRLSLLPIVAAFTVLIAVLGRRLTGAWWAGPLAAASAFFVLSPNPYPWRLDGWFSTFATSPYDDGSVSRLVMWTSPTQTFGEMLFAALAVVLVDLVRRESGRGRWVLLVVLMTAVMGGKATFLPILLAALGLVVVVERVIRKRWHWPAMIMAAITFGYVLFAQFVLFGGASQGLAINPLHQMRITGGPYTVGFTTGTDVRLWRLLAALALTLLCWAFIWGGIAGLAVRRRVFDPEIVMLLGIGVAGMGGILLFGDEGGAEGWFLGSARPYLTLAAVVGIVALTPIRKLSRFTAAALAGSVLLGAAVVHLVRTGATIHGVAIPHGGPKRLLFDLAWPYALLVLATATFAAGLLLLRRRLTALRGLTATLVLAMLVGMCGFTMYNNLSSHAKIGLKLGWRNAIQQPLYMPPGTQEAGRWLRDHSNANDLVATNAHCVIHGTDYASSLALCDNRHFFFSAYSERRFLIEGWGFTNTTHEQSQASGAGIAYAGYWDLDRLNDNDLAFSQPTAQNVDRLRDKYGVKWLWVDLSQYDPGPALGNYATLRYHVGDCLIYEINP